MVIVPKGWRQNPNGLSDFCKNKVIILGVFSLKLTKLYPKEVNVLFSFVNKFCWAVTISFLNICKSSLTYFLSRERFPGNIVT